MKVYCLLIDGKPSVDNEEGEEVNGAYINCWVRAENKTDAVDKAIDFVAAEGWEIICIEEINIVNRERYTDDPECVESLECFDRAVNEGVGAKFYTWINDDMDD